MPNNSRTLCRLIPALLVGVASGASARAADVYAPPVVEAKTRVEAPDSRLAVRTDFRWHGAANDDGESGAATDLGPAAAKSVPLSSKRLPPAAGDSSPKSSGWSTALSALGSLAVVLGLFLAVAWFLRRTGPKSMTVLPAAVFEVLGHSPLAARQQAQLVRCGGKLLLLSVTAGGAETLAEITDPEEVERLVGLCQQARPNSATASFRHLFAQFSGNTSADAAAASQSARRGLVRLGRSRPEAADV